MIKYFNHKAQTGFKSCKLILDKITALPVLLLSLLIISFAFVILVLWCLIGYLTFFNLLNTQFSFKQVPEIIQGMFKNTFMVIRISIEKYILFPVLYLPCIVISLVRQLGDFTLGQMRVSQKLLQRESWFRQGVMRS